MKKIKEQKETYTDIDNKYEAASFAISSIFKNWKKFLILVLLVLFLTGLILLLLLPGYKFQTSSGSVFEKTPVSIPSSVKLEND